MSDILKEAIADAKAVRETALQNAKMALEEAFAPHLKNMLSAKISEEEHEDAEDEMEMDVEDEMDVDVEEEMDVDDHPAMDDEEEPEMEDPHVDPEVEEEGMHKNYRDDEMEDGMEDDDEDEELDLEAIIKELEAEVNEEEEAEEPSVSEDTEEVTEGEEDPEEEPADEPEVSEEVVEGEEEIAEGDEEEAKAVEELNTIKAELGEYKEAVEYLQDKLHEVNVLNAKLLFTNKLFKEYALDKDQKVKVVETMDRAQTTREIKLVYSTLCEAFSQSGKINRKQTVKESASAPVASTRPKKKIISEENKVADRFKKLAGII